MLEINVIVVLFLILGLVIFVFGLFANGIVPISYIPPVVLHLFLYGRANAPSKEKSAIVKLMEVPKSWFAHFYLYCVIVQFSIFFTLVSLYVFGSNPSDSKIYSWLRCILDAVANSSESSLVISPSIALLVSFLFLFHVSRRFYETCYVSVYSDTTMNVIHYLIAFTHYTGSPLSLIANNPGFAGKSIGTNLHSSWDWSQFGLLQWMGIASFVYGNIQQYKAHAGFANLRKKDDKVVSHKHKIPRGGLFEVVSNPNYWAEILIYVAFGLILSFQSPCWNAILLWVIANQVTAGGMNHRWYKEKFPEYPKNRKAIIPYIY